MPRIYRLMKVEDGQPQLGAAAMTLGVRLAQGARPADIPIDPNGCVHPGTGGMSVYSSMRAMPARMIPKRLQSIVPFAAGSNNLKIWAIGEGPFASGSVAARLSLRIDPEDVLHGFVEPSAIMTFEQYVGALIETRLLWVVAED
jgi:hypothetical protein